jgi:hypothetical protein
LKGLDTSAIQRAVLLFGLSVFVIFFGAYGFIAPWGGDIHVYLAAVHSLYRDTWNPSDVSLGVKSGNSVFFGPYLILVSLVGKALGVTPYRALQIAGVFNIALYAYAVTLFCRTFSALPKSPWPPLLFLAVSLFLRVKIYSWSSEMSYQTLSIIQAYPSVLGWSLALFAFVTAEQVIRTGSAVAIVGLSLLIALSALTHPISATWTIGIVGVRALYFVAIETWQASRQGAPLAAALRTVSLPALSLIGALVLGVGLSLLWPYYSPLVLVRYAGVEEHDPFSSEPFTGIAVAYLLAIAALLLSRRPRIYQFWIVAFLATFGAFELLRFLNIGFVGRYVLFMGFFAQFVVADCAAVAMSELFSGKRQGSGAHHGRVKSGIYFALFAIAFVYSPVLHAPLRSGILTVQAWREGKSTERAYYDRWGPLRTVIRPGEVVMMPSSWDAGLDIPAVTGAKVVAAALMVGVPDSDQRSGSIERFFTPGQTAKVRFQELKRWSATRVVLLAPALDLATEMQALLGTPVWRDETRIIFAVPPDRLAIE